MEQLGKNPQQNVIAVIPARLKSTRLEGKLLLSLDGKPLILHTIEQAALAKTIDRIIVATDSREIFDVVNNAGFEVQMTSVDHPSGSDRISEVALSLPGNCVIVNVQGDEPLIPPATIDAAVNSLLSDSGIAMATTCEVIDSAADVISADVVKVVTDQNGDALYFSRSPIPFPREHVRKYKSLENALDSDPDLISAFRKHTGLYVYRREFLLEYSAMKSSRLENLEMLEQLRVLERGFKIRVVEVEESSIGVDTQEDFDRAAKLIELRRREK